MADVVVRYRVRLPAPESIVGVIRAYLSDPAVIDVAPGAELPNGWFPADADETATLAPPDVAIDAVVDARGYSAGRWYVHTGSGWWRLETAEPDSERLAHDMIVGEITPANLPVSVPAVAVGDLRIDDIMYASGWGSPVGQRVIDVVRSGQSTNVRVESGWYRWSRPFVRVASL